MGKCLSRRSGRQAREEEPVRPAASGSQRIGEEEEQASAQNVSSAPQEKTKHGKQKPTLTDEPWRKTKGWDREFRNELKKNACCRPETSWNVPFYNIALTGEVGAGKSSYFNSLNSIFQEDIAGARADVGKKATSLTTKYRVYKITPKDANEHLSLRICDTMGLQPNKEHDSSNILKAVNGHVPDEFEFSDSEINQDTPHYIPYPTLEDKAHCVAIVINALGLRENLMLEATKRKLQNLRQQLEARRTYILLTHIDDACEEVHKDVTKVYHSIAIRDLVSKVSTMLGGLPGNQIFPIMNYIEQIELDNAMDILLLQPLCQMLRSAKNVLKDEIDAQQRQVGAALKTQRGQPFMQATS